MEQPQSGCRNKIDKPFTRSKTEWLFFYCLCSKYTMTMTKAKFIMVTPTNPKKSSLMIVNNIVSTIATPPLSISQQIAVEQVCIHQRLKGGNQLCLFSFPIFSTIKYFQKNKRTYNFFFCFLFLFFLLSKNHCPCKK